MPTRGIIIQFCLTEADIFYKEQRMSKQIEQEVKKAIESLNDGDKIQLELDKKNQVLKIWKLKLHRIGVKNDRKD